MWDLIVSVPVHCLSFYFSHDMAQIMVHVVGEVEVHFIVVGLTNIKFLRHQTSYINGTKSVNNRT